MVCKTAGPAHLQYSHYKLCRSETLSINLACDLRLTEYLKHDFSNLTVLFQWPPEQGGFPQITGRLLRLCMVPESVINKIERL